jgi:hypothetical protein
MITISFKTSSPKAIAFARKLMESKRETQKEMRESYKNNPEIRNAIERLRKQNEAN